MLRLEYHREPLLLQVLHGYSQQDIADRLGISSAGVRIRLHRAPRAAARSLGGRDMRDEWAYREERGASMAFGQEPSRLPRVLLVEPEQALGEMLAGCFEDAGAHAVLVRSRATAGQFVSAMLLELTLMTSRVEDGSGVTLAAELARIQPSIRLALVGNRHSVHTRFGGQDFLHAMLVKPIPRQRLLGLLEDALGVQTPSSSIPAMTGMPWMAEAEISHQREAETNRAVLARFAHL